MIIQGKLIRNKITSELNNKVTLNRTINKHQIQKITKYEKIKRLELDLEKVNKPMKYKNNVALNIPELNPSEQPGYNINNLPKIPDYCNNTFDKKCSYCAYNLHNQATLLEFGKIVDIEDFDSKAFIGVLGTDTRVRCSLLNNNKNTT